MSRVLALLFSLFVAALFGAVVGRYFPEASPLRATVGPGVLGAVWLASLAFMFRPDATDRRIWARACLPCALFWLFAMPASVVQIIELASRAVAERGWAVAAGASVLTIALVLAGEATLALVFWRVYRRGAATPLAA